MDRNLTSDPLWRTEAFRLALYTADVAWSDVTLLGRDRRTRSLSDQLYRALGSVPANIAEGYSRDPGADRAKYCGYALGSARESRVWYHLARPKLGADTVASRLDVLTSVVRLLVVALPQERHRHASRADR